MQGAEYRVLGPLEVRFDGDPVVVPAGKGRVLLATLLLRPDEFVSVDELVERLWEGSPPSADRAAKTLHMTVARLRQALGPANCVVTGRNGYLGEVGNLDLLRFRALAGSNPHAALGLWRGRPLQNVVSDALHRDDVPSLVEERLVVLERRIEQDLDDGRTAELVPELRALAAEHPMRERFWAQLMVALYRSDQQAAALDAYRQVSTLLADELGIDPGTSLRNLHQSILRAEPELSTRRDVVVPRQLPPDLALFTGREDDLARLDRLLPSGTAGRAVVISAIAGSAGVGKTALAVHWAHRVRERFPDGQLAVNLRGYDREAPLSPHDALGQLLRALGRSPQEIPPETDQRIGVYRSLLADRRVLVLLDNARTADQVRPLLPAGGRSVVVITSRSDLRGLVALNDAKVLKLGVLPPADAVQLLTDMIGADRALAEPEAVAELARLCACLPLALRIAASMLAGEPHLAVRDLTDQLSTADRLAELEVGDDREAAVRAAFDLSHAALPPEERRMFQVLGLPPRADFTPLSAGALLGVTSRQALRLLRTLARAHLVEEHAPQRFSQHDLLRLYAGERAAAEMSAMARRASMVRFLDHYLHSVDNAERSIRANRHEKPLTERDPVVEAVEFGDRESAIAWCRREHELLVELNEFALAHGHFGHAWKLPSCMWGHLQLHGSTDDFLRLFGIALEAARRSQDRYGEAVSLHNLGVTYKNMHRLDDALDLLHRAWRIRQERGDHFGLAVNCSELAAVHLRRGDPAAALRYDREAGEHHRAAGNAVGLARSLNNLANTLLEMGEFVKASEAADDAVDVYSSLGGPDVALEDTRAMAKFGMGDLDAAVRIYRDMADKPLLDHTNNSTKVEILLNGAKVFSAAGDRTGALSWARKALTVTERGKLAGGNQIRDLVRELED
ncbi:AfsR/SARP family transcriptional regulator [Lentzea sp.]|uniref:AfsR/SARP family transcriptional regulator n=1 Tax=Lentzea sp. TaxID=56099 RepID=UPI002C749992|nr:BTAD domain-containing putative transcriptional regulator [Lentzea sp.]HUQ57880.1 BTAD domain-containing putative transcriptional regulator [Lentzea sp.]